MAPAAGSTGAVLPPADGAAGASGSSKTETASTKDAEDGAKAEADDGNLPAETISDEASDQAEPEGGLKTPTAGAAETPYQLKLFAGAAWEGGTFTDKSGKIKCDKLDAAGCKAKFADGELVTITAPATLKTGGMTLRYSMWLCQLESLPFPSMDKNLCKAKSPASCEVTVSDNIVCSAKYDQ